MGNNAGNSRDVVNIKTAYGNFFLNEAEKGKIYDVVIFLRIEPGGARDKKKTKKYSLQLDVKTEMALPVKVKKEVGIVMLENIDRLTKALHDFRQLPYRARIFGAAQSLNQLVELEKNLGVEIYQTFFPGNIGKTFGDFLDLLYRRKINRLTLVIISSIPEILDIPFEMIRKDRHAEPLLLSYKDFHLQLLCTSWRTQNWDHISDHKQ